MRFLGCVFRENSAMAGGALRVRGTDGASMLFSRLIDNSASRGGAIVLVGGTLEVEACVVLGHRGSAVVVESGELDLVSSVLAANSGIRGGGLFLSEFTVGARISNCTISENLAVEGGGIYSESAVSPVQPSTTL